jgi:Collagen triple helix repeat (20 copies)
MPNFHSMRSDKFPPRGVVGDVYLAAETRKLFIAVADGRLIPLEGLLNPVTVEGARGAQGPAGCPGGTGPRGEMGPPGRDGKNGESVSGPAGQRGERGPRGLPGVDGRDGSDGRNGVDGAIGATGPAGPKGEKGEVLYVGDAEMAQAVKDARAAMIAQHARFLAVIENAMSHAKNLHTSYSRIVEGIIARMKKDAGL